MPQLQIYWGQTTRTVMSYTGNSEYYEYQQRYYCHAQQFALNIIIRITETKHWLVFFLFISLQISLILTILVQCVCRKCWKQKNAKSFVLSLLEENFPNTNLNSCWLDVILIRHFYDFFVAPPDNWVTQLHIYAHQATKLKRYQISTKNQQKTPQYGAFISVLTLNK